MSVYCVTGKLGNGKTLVTVGRIRDALRQGLRVATNLDVNLKNMFGNKAKEINFVRLPDKPTLFDLQSIGRGYEGDYDESKFGILVLDECGTWFNSRNWQDKDRKAVNDWFLHARKLRWHVYIIIQDISILDSQARDAICELLVTCRRLDNLRVPLIGGLVKTLTGYNLTLPRIHRAKVTYADGLISDVWVYRGNDLFSCYQTDQLFLQSYPHGTHSILPPFYTTGRYLKPRTWRHYVRLTKIYWKRFSAPIMLATGLLFGAFLMFLTEANNIRNHVIRYELQAHPVNLIDQHQSSSSSSSSASSKGAEQPDTIKGKFSQFANSLKIIGHYTVNDKIIYQFQDDSPALPDKPAHYFTSSDLRGMGFALKPEGECSVKLEYDTGSSTVYCF